LITLIFLLQSVSDDLMNKLQKVVFNEKLTFRAGTIYNFKIIQK